MFNILISADETAWERPGRFDTSLERFKEQSGDEAARLDPKSPATLSVLENVWTFLAYETMVSATDCPFVRFGMLKDIRVEGRLITFAFIEHGRMSRADFEAAAVRLQLGKWALSRTHWSVKDGEIPHDVYSKIAATPKRYDVVLSFAGEDRPYVDAVASELLTNGVEVFYDRYEEVTLWGKDLAEHLAVVYSNRARFCVMFVSKHYAEKVWTTHERRSALERALLERHTEYILPLRFDDTVVPGLRSTVGYFDLRTRTPAQVAQLIIQKLRTPPLGAIALP